MYHNKSVSALDLILLSLLQKNDAPKQFTALPFYFWEGSSLSILLTRHQYFNSILRLRQRFRSFIYMIPNNLMA